MSHKVWTRALICLWILIPAVAGLPPAEATPVQESPDPAPSRRALLVGINDYSTPSRTAPDERGDIPNLHGAVHDVESMAEMLIGRYGFQPADVHLLKDRDATREAILRDIRKHLVEPAQAGDILVFYYAGHGSQVRNSKSKERDKLDETIVAADLRDIRDKELRQLFSGVAKTARLVVVLDSCHSGSGVRGLPDGSVPRAIPPDLRDVADGKDYGPPIEELGGLVLAAAQEDQRANEGRDETGRWSGVFSLALLKALRAAPTSEPSRYVFERARAWLGAAGQYQNPALEGTPARLDAPLFGPPSNGQTGPVVAVGKVEDDGQVLLLGGWIDGLAPGSELRRLDGKEGARPRLRVTRLEGLRGSRAEILETNETGEKDANVEQGQLFEVVTWVTEQNPLRVWVPRTETTDAAQKLAEGLASNARQGKLKWVEDPTETTPSYVVRWSGTGFELMGPGNRTRSLGPRPSAAGVLPLLEGDKRLFVQLPAPTALLETLDVGPNGRHNAVVAVEDPLQATYVLAGRLQDGAVEYAWIRPGTLQTDQPETHLPVRSAWIRLASAKPEALEETGWKLQDKVLRLYKVFAWNLLQPTHDARAAFPYQLAVADAKGALVDDRELVSGRDYTLVLRTEDGAPVDGVEDRYVYIFAIDGSGASSLLYPQVYLSNENKYPGSLVQDGLAPGRIDLGKYSLFDVLEPFGDDTFFLFTSAEPISDPGLVFQYGGVRGQEPPQRGPLATLLAEVGSTKRSTRSLALASSWSIEKTIYRTAPADR